MTKPTQQLADEMADALCHEYHGAYHPDTVSFKEALKHDLFLTVPLLELLEVARAVKDIPHSYKCNLNTPYPFSDKAREEWSKLKCNCWKSALTNLQKKVEL